MILPPLTTTLADAIHYVESRRGQGVECPCCKQFAKVYKRKLNSSMARGLIWLWKAGAAWKYVDVQASAPRYVVASRELPKLEYWGLIEAKRHQGTTSRCSGQWRLTPTGSAFVANERTVPSHVFLYNGQVLGFEQTKVSIEQALGRRFNYRELMAAT